MNIKELEQIIRILKENEVTDFELEHDGTHIKLNRGTMLMSAPSPRVQSVDVQPAIVSPAPALNGHGASSNGGSQVKGDAAMPSNFVKIQSPLVGTFYRKPAPDSEPFVKEGQQVKKGDTLCIVEAMKLMNEIEAEVSGRVEKIMPSDGSVVEYGEVLFFINPAA